jgi:hypothetical protein
MRRRHALQSVAVPGAIYDVSEDGRCRVFDTDRNIVPEALTLRGRPEAPLDEVDSFSNGTRAVRVKEPSYFLGPITPHFGHFLLEVMGRLWAYGSAADGVERLAYTGYRPNRLLRKCPYMGEIFATLGIDADALMAVSRRTFFKSLLVPAPSFRMGAYVFPQFFETFDRLRRLMLGGRGVTEDPRPVYLSKGKLKKAVTGIANEREMEESFSALGVDIVHPETLTFEEQVRLMNSRTTIVGVLGSAFHTLLLTGGRKRIRYIVPIPKVNSNYVVIDKHLRNASEFFFAPTVEVFDETLAQARPEAGAGERRRPGRPPFRRMLSFASPRELAEEVVSTI